MKFCNISHNQFDNDFSIPTLSAESTYVTYIKNCYFINGGDNLSLLCMRVYALFE